MPHKNKLCHNFRLAELLMFLTEFARWGLIGSFLHFLYLEDMVKESQIMNKVAPKFQGECC